MATVFIPPNLRSLTGERETIEVEGRTVSEVINRLDQQFPGFRDRLCDNDELRPGIAVAVGSSISSLGLLEPLDADSEVHFLPAISGGST